MILKQGNMFSLLNETYKLKPPVRVLLVTTNSTVRNDGHLVMGRGAALEATKIWADLPFLLGSVIRNKPEYGVIIAPSVYSYNIWGIWIGAFQVKHFWGDPASHDLISTSTQQLMTIADAFPGWRFAVNYPGIGNGRLDRTGVSQIIKFLPDNVEVWEK